jgi:hypothetical protein
MMNLVFEAVLLARYQLHVQSEEDWL